ncbi:leukotriene A-4 hydrol [Piedraia hortae CBS 480.64]|uniref:Leukotriene A(4) hydrolase n=1 Tax=Piedraia hortae CBS 480.64 TaxID=1314780 RepID=A0A6A7CDC6_9PEZI|nr:leukotriene A-4 hydrol [Piedraia hortae CBS 480.64]
MTTRDLSISQSGRRDPNTLSNYDAWRTKHTKIDFIIDFEARKLHGTVCLTLENLAKNVPKVVLDTSYLNIQNIRIGNEATNFSLAPTRTEPYGTPLTVKVDPKHLNQSSCIELSIDMQTTKDCTAIQWLTPAQTSNKKHPYMFSQCQAIHARSMFPCQDTPDVKSTYTYHIQSALPVLASGLPLGNEDSKSGSNGKAKFSMYTFEQKIPIPSYLVAIASGDLASASVGPRSTVWTSPDEVKACQWELEADTETFIQTAEKIVYPYVWTMYNVLVLPPSFPYGGMENPIYTFATPTIISGDRQNVDVIAHELSHSYSGNLVTNASWEHFWLNEGWTTYLERRIQAAVHGGDQSRDFSAIIGWKALEDSIKQFGEDHNFTKLIPDMKEQDPDESFSSIPYEKGFVFLYHLEKLLGADKWNKFIPQYFTTFKERSVDSYEFKANLLNFFKSDKDASDKLNKIKWDEWFYKPGFPPKPDFDTTLADQCYRLAEKWQKLSSGEDENFAPSKSDIGNFSSNQSVVFLEQLQTLSTPLKPQLIDLMGRTYGYANSQNVELVSRFFVLGLMAGAESIYRPAADLLGKVGRMKFVRPLYTQLKKRDADLAQTSFEKNKDFYHPICRAMVERILKG